MDERTAKLLLKAIRSLSQREQDQVLAALLLGSTQPMSLTRPVPPPMSRDVVMFSDPAAMVFQQQLTAGAAVLPIRLPPDLHERLRRWSVEHGFSMAGVVRGLVERFLDEQSGKAPPRKRAAKPRTAKRPASRPRSKRATTARG